MGRNQHPIRSTEGDAPAVAGIAAVKVVRVSGMGSVV